MSQCRLPLGVGDLDVGAQWGECATGTSQMTYQSGTREAGNYYRAIRFEGYDLPGTYHLAAAHAREGVSCNCVCLLVVELARLGVVSFVELVALFVH